MIRMVITACPRSGTKYTAEVLKALGYKAAHECCFNPWVQSVVNAPHDIEVSWMAAPFLQKLPPNILIVHQVRNPRAVIRSLVSFHDISQANNYSRIARAHLQIPENLDRQATAEAFWRQWNWLIQTNAKGRPYLRIHVEDFLASVGVPVDCNTWGKTAALRRSLESGTLGLAQAYGYSI